MRKVQFIAPCFWSRLTDDAMLLRDANELVCTAQRKM
jgi:hypothetical protein